MKLVNQQLTNQQLNSNSKVIFYNLHTHNSSLMQRHIPPTPNKSYLQANQQQQQEIVSKKDHKIQQLMIENNHLKRQLSQLILKTSTTMTPLQSGIQSPKQHQVIKPNTVEFNALLRNTLEHHSYNNSNNYSISKNNNNLPKYYTQAVSTPTPNHKPIITPNHNNVSFQFTTNNNSNHNTSSSSFSANNASFNKVTNTIYKQNSATYNNQHQTQANQSSFNIEQPINKLTIQISPYITPIQKHNRSNTHSIDMIGTDHNYQSPQSYLSPNKNTFVTSPHHHYQTHKKSMTMGQSFNASYPMNQEKQNIIYISSNLNSFSIQSPNQNKIAKQDQSIEQQLYKEKMMKLKAKKSPRHRQISQEKKKQLQTPSSLVSKLQKVTDATTNVTKVNNTKIIVNKNNNSRSIDKIEQLKKAHEVLKAKLSPTKEVKDNTRTQISTKKTEPNQDVKVSSNKNALSIGTTKNGKKQRQKSPIRKLLSSESLKTIESTKKLPKYIPKVFSKQNGKQTLTEIIDQKQRIQLSKRIEQNDKVSTIQKVTNKDEVVKQQLEQLNNRTSQGNNKQVKGRVYLEDETKIVVVGKTNKQIQYNSRKQIQQRTATNKDISINEIKKQVITRSSNKLKSDKSQLSNQPTDSTRKQSTDESVGDIVRMRMMRRNSNKVYLQEDVHEVRRSSNNKSLVGEKAAAVVNRSVRSRDNNDSGRQKISSIEQIHMISQDYQQQQESTIKQKKLLYNQVYCCQQSRIKLTNQSQ